MTNSPVTGVTLTYVYKYLGNSELQSQCTITCYNNVLVYGSESRLYKKQKVTHKM